MSHWLNRKAYVFIRILFKPKQIYTRLKHSFLYKAFQTDVMCRMRAHAIELSVSLFLPVFWAEHINYSVCLRKFSGMRAKSVWYRDTLSLYKWNISGAFRCAPETGEHKWMGERVGWASGWTKRTQISKAHMCQNSAPYITSLVYYILIFILRKTYSTKNVYGQLHADGLHTTHKHSTKHIICHSMKRDILRSCFVCVWCPHLLQRVYHFNACPILTPKHHSNRQ